jgi:hypothetical protein
MVTYMLIPEKLPEEGKEEFRKLWKAAQDAGALVKQESPFSFTYSKEFLAFWDSVPFKRHKDRVWEAWKEALKGGHKALEIQKGVPTLIRQEKARQKAKGEEYIPISMITWIKDRRWTDEPDDDLSQPRKSGLQKDADKIESILDCKLTSQDKLVLSECFGDGLTMKDVEERKHLWWEGKSVRHYLYEVTQIVNNQRKP